MSGLDIKTVGLFCKACGTYIGPYHLPYGSGCGASKPLDIKIINTWDAYIGYAACFGDYDEGVKVSTGSTEDEAVMELVENYRDWD
jgi:hypothetical protein